MDDANTEATAYRRAISGTYDGEKLNKLLWPVAWSGAVGPETRAACEGAVRELVEEAREALRQDGDAVAVEIKDGEVVATVHGG